jgi:hypothetical protein
VVGEPADGEEIGRTVKCDAVIEREAFARENFVRDRPESCIGEK